MRNTSQLLPCLSLLWLMLATVSTAHGDDSREEIRQLATKFCVDCHQADHAEAGINVEALLANNDFAADFRRWRRVAHQLQQKLMPPESSDRQPTEGQRRQLLSGVQQKIAAAEQQHGGEPGNVVMRRLTSAEYGYSILDLTGIEFDVERNFVSDAVGGAGFTNTGIVQFTQDSTLERYLEAARRVADHAVVGTGPLQFFQDPGQTGFELSAINRILTIYRQHGFRTSAGEGGEPFGLEKYPLAFLTAWKFRYRNRLGHPDVTLKSLADDADIDERFAEYIYQTLTADAPSFPTSAITQAWHRLPVPVAGRSPDMKSVTEACHKLAELLRSWQYRFGGNPDAKEEAPILRADRFVVQQTQPFEMNLNWPEGTSTVHLVISIESANGDGSPNAAIVWKNPQVQFRDYAKRLADPEPLRDFLTSETVAQLKFGGQWFGDELQTTDFGTIGTEPLAFELPIPDGARSGRLLVTAELDGKHGEDCIVRCTIAQLEETDQGKSVSGLLANPDSPAFPNWKNGVLEFAQLLPQMSQREPAPSDRDPVPPPIDDTYNNAERNFFHIRMKYFRDDEFLSRNILNDQTRRQLDQAWADLTGSFDFHNTWLQFLARKYGKELNGRRIEKLDADWIAKFPDAGRRYVKSLKEDFEKSQLMFAAAEPGHIPDVIHFASKAWRRPLSEVENIGLQEFYRSLRSESKLDHRAAVCAVLARVLVSPQFLYRSERVPLTESVASNVAVPLTQSELASRLSFLIWSSVPDEELRRAAAAGELLTPTQLTGQVRRLLQDQKSWRFATEFFGQWFGFYRFHQFRGIDEKQFPEFSNSLQQSMHDEAVHFFDFIVRQDRPLDEILLADYAFVNQELARHYGLSVELNDSRELRRVSAAGASHRGGLLRLGAVLATTSAPRRTSPVKRGDWILRRVLGAHVPPPPADAGSIAADEVAGDGLSIRQRLIAHRRDASCNNCHARFDAFGFALENYDPIGRWRTHYRDDKPVETSGSLRDGRTISGVDELHQYLRSELPRFHETLAVRLLGYALGRQESVGDRMLIVQLKQQMQDGDGMVELMEWIVSSRQFRYRQNSVDSASLRTSSESANE
jgi:hypothetical protein